ncbi:MAG: gentisate 1,2-dioxygenase [Vicinamibacterales bacterium]
MDSATATVINKPDLPPERRDLYKRLDQKHTAPLWEVLGKIIPPEPTPEIVPVLWHYDDVRPLLMEAGRLLTAREAERRVLVLENPGLRGQSRITQSLYAGLQLILPGEIAPAHRHAAAALRFIIEGTGAYTAVEGERTMMHPGDFILTPSWTYHDHGNPGQVPVIWLDGLDVPIVNLFDASFRESFPGDTQPNTVPEGDSHARYAANMLPVDWESARPSSPIFNYPYSRSRETLAHLYQHGSLHECHGVKMRFINPATGGAPMPTIGAFMQLLPKGFRGTPYRATDSTVYAAVEGHGRTRVGDVTYEWRPRDIFVVPSWTWTAHEAADEAVLFSFSDRPAQKALGLWREQLGKGD